MTKTVPLLLLLLCVLGCNKSVTDSSTPSNSANNSNAASPPKIAKVVDLPATIGKSKDEIKKMITGTLKNEDPWLEYSLPECDLTFKFDKAGKATDATLTFKPISAGGATISGLQTAEQLGTMAGVDVKGKTAKSTGALADTYEQEIGGKKAEISFYKISGKFHMVMIIAK